MDFEVFRPDLDKALAYSDGSKGGHPPFDPVLMFKILVIQTLNATLVAAPKQRNTNGEKADLWESPSSDSGSSMFLLTRRGRWRSSYGRSVWPG